MLSLILTEKKSKKTYKKSLKIYRCPTAKQKKLKIELLMVDNENIR